MVAQSVKIRIQSLPPVMAQVMGKAGSGSPGRAPVLKGRVLRWLVQKKEVMAFVQARPAEGGAGALVVLLKPVGR